MKQTYLPLFILLSAAVTALFLLYVVMKGSRRMDNRLGRIQPWMALSFVCLLLLGAFISTWYFSADFLPPPTSIHGKKIVPLFNTTLVITGITFVATQLLLFYFAFRYRSGVSQKVVFLVKNTRLELYWIVAPAVIFIFLFIWGQILWDRFQQPAGADALTIDVLGQQFNWKVRYPGPDHQLGRAGFRYYTPGNDMGIDPSDQAGRDDFVPLQMHVPVGRQIDLHLRSKDVIHSFFIPYMRVKMDALPGMGTTTHFTPTKTTRQMRNELHDPDFNYEVACAELCGRMHFAMKIILVVDTPAEYRKWAASQVSWLKEKNLEANKKLR